MPNDFASFLDIYHSQGTAKARDAAENWRQERLIDVTQYGLMISYLERQLRDTEGSIATILQAIKDGGESAPLNLSLAEDYIQIGEYRRAVESCDKVINAENVLIASRFLSTALILKSYAFIKLGEFEIAETILRILRQDLTIYINGKRETPVTLLASLG